MTNLYRIFTRHRSVTTDSRNIPAGSIFFALRGDKFDGNRYAAEALAKGAAYAVIDDPTLVASMQADAKGTNESIHGQYILVDNTLATLQRLAKEHRTALGLRILAITGSNGKTTTKELVTRTLARKFKVEATKGNLNNHIGVPLTLLSLNSDTEMGIVEMGANNPGEIAALCKIALPDFGLITNIGLAHLEGFGSPEGVARAKGELYDFLAANGGFAFFRQEDDKLREMTLQRPALQTIPYSGALADELKSNLAGDFNKFNIAAAVAIGTYFGVEKTDIDDAIASYAPDNMRSQRTDTQRNTVILDCYNANPSSMSAALGNLPKEKNSKPVALILGDMGELGSYAEQEHRGVLELASKIEGAQQFLVGSHFAAAAKTVAGNGNRLIFADTTALRGYLIDNPIEGKLILVKGSRSIGLEKIADLL